MAERDKIRWIIRRDLPAILQIEGMNFQYPWSAEVFLGHLKAKEYIGIVLERDGRVVGYAVYRLGKHHLEIINLAVHLDYQGFGVGTALTDKLKGKLGPTGRKKILCVVREANLDAQMFFQAKGFAYSETLKEHYEDYPEEDAYVFEYTHQPAPVVERQVVMT